MIILISNILLIRYFKSSIYKKLPTIINAIIIDFILINLLNGIKNNVFDIYQNITVDSDKELLMLLQLSTNTFSIYLLTMFLIFIIFSLFKLRDKKTKEIIDISTLEKDFN